MIFDARPDYEGERSRIAPCPLRIGKPRDWCSESELLAVVERSMLPQVRIARDYLRVQIATFTFCFCEGLPVFPRQVQQAGGGGGQSTDQNPAALFKGSTNGTVRESVGHYSSPLLKRSQPV